jgi:hypothetical protein
MYNPMSDRRQFMISEQWLQSFDQGQCQICAGVQGGLFIADHFTGGILDREMAIGNMPVQKPFANQGLIAITRVVDGEFDARRTGVQGEKRFGHGYLAIASSIRAYEANANS